MTDRFGIIALNVVHLVLQLIKSTISNLSVDGSARGLLCDEDYLDKASQVHVIFERFLFDLGVGFICLLIASCFGAIQYKALIRRHQITYDP